MSKPPTIEQIRHAIDTGKASDKVAAPDPAAVPLGGDDEAGGTPAGATRLAQALHALTGETGQGSGADAQPQTGFRMSRPGSHGFNVWLVAAGLVAMLVLVGALVALRR